MRALAWVMVLTKGATIASYMTEKKGKKRFSRVMATPGCTMKTPTFVFVNLREAFACQLLNISKAAAAVIQEAKQHGNCDLVARLALRGCKL